MKTRKAVLQHIKNSHAAKTFRKHLKHHRTLKKKPHAIRKTYDLCAADSYACERTKVNVPRKLMPQLNGSPEGVRRVLREGKKLGVPVKKGRIDPQRLGYSQNEISIELTNNLVKAIREKTLKDTFVYVSQDNYVIDGHHRVAAHKEVGTPKINIVKIGLPIKEALEWAKMLSKKTEALVK